MAITINGSGTIAGLSTGGLPDGTVDADTLAADAVTVPKIGYNGAILQVVQGQDTASASWSISSQAQWNDVLTVNITPVAAGSNILVMWYTNASANAVNQRGSCRLNRSSTILGVGGPNGNKQQASHCAQMNLTYTNYGMHFSQNFLDDPTYTLGDQLSYTLQIGFEQSAGTIYVNRSAGESNDNTHFRGATYMQLVEVAA